jgi:hypothetical protein
MDESRSPVSSKRIAVVVTIVFLLTVYPSGCISNSDRSGHSVHFAFASKASGPSEIIMPLPSFEPLADRLEIADGDGEFEIVETSYGRCMRITFDSDILIERKYYPKNSNEINSMTVNLTTMDPNITDTTPWDLEDFKIPARHFWFNVSYGPIDEFHIILTMYDDGIRTTYSYWSTYFDIGWNRDVIKGTCGEENAP